MRPLSLTLGGLHSYREPVTIDFESLGRYGLFGIFGPIGSGKSTILDAITLALYGLVDRLVSRSRRGLVHAGDPTAKCEVRLRFAVGSDRPSDPRAVYEVHRAYRDEGGVAQRVASRLVELPPGGRPVVLAEKETDVNAAVEQLVGLSADDFMRAVVLPQGRFVQLLQLKGQERRQMLQRIFRLQAYGEDLRARVRERQVAGRARQAEVRGELAGLGDASPAAVTAAERASRQARAARDAAERALLEHEARHAEGARLRERQQRFLALSVALDALEFERPKIERLSAALALAARLRPLALPLRHHGEAVERSTAAAALAEAAREDRARATAAHALCAVSHREQRERMRTEGPAMRERIGLLAEAAREEEALGAAVAEERAWAEQIAQHTALERSAREAADQHRVRVGELDKERRKARRELGRQRVEPEERERVTRAARAADALAVARRLVEEARAEELAAAGARIVAEHRHAAAETSASLARAAWEALAAHDAPVSVALQPLAERVAVLEERLSSRREREAERTALLAERGAVEQALSAARSDEAAAAGEVHAASQVLRGAERAVAEAEAALVAHQKRTAASELASRLAPGAPCAVCGSVHHPAPAVAPRGDPAPAVDAHKAGRQRAIERRERALEARATAESARVGTERALAALDQRLRELDATLAELPREAELRAVVAERDAASRAASAHESHRRESEAARLALERSLAPLAAAEATVAAAEAECVRTREAREARAAAEGLAWAAFDRERGPLTLFDVPSAVAGLEARDRAAHALATRVEALDLDREATARAADDHRAQADRSVAALERARERKQQVDARCAELRASLARVVGTERAAPLLASASSALVALEQDVARLEREVDAAQAALASATEAHVAAGSAATAAEEERQRLGAALVTQASAVVGAVADPVGAVRVQLEALPDDALLARHAAEVERWREEERSVRVRLAAVEGEGAGDAPGDEAWAALGADLARAQEAVESARDAAVVAARVFEELAARSVRWSALCAVSLALDLEVGRLDELAQLLRGDRFVEYVANDHLQELTERASQHLVGLSGGRYRLSLDDEGGFVVRDDELGGSIRPVTGLSGGESFLTALALALSLSSLVQARSTRPLGFFFLDEGFGTLDPEALDRVMTAIERLRDGDRIIGLISHVPEVRDRVPRYLRVSREPAGGSVVETVDG